ncbi:hypothetical protein [Ralstonia pickettii]|uniref:hypothetical protein n=1 Tax=Ralstonia pickettii TaxID=329 RepID=UPI0015BABE18|nr:hypothetical protein [Ralstonia pickettii]NWK44784.1 hypothetical protein [Ralstonia pickettii]
MSLGIATYGSWQRGGTVTEQALTVALGSVAVLYTHLLPMRWNALPVVSKVAAFVFWCLSLAVVLYGQVTFFMVAHQHAGNQRAATVPATVVRSGINRPSGRSLTEIARDAARVSADLAHTELRRCAADCSVLKARKTILAAQVAALDAEASEVRRREAEEDRRNDRAERDEALRATLRADPVASTIASWLGTTERRLELVLAVACAVVLEGAAVIGWLLMSLTWGRAGGGEEVASDRAADASNCEAATPEREVVVPASGSATDASAVVTPDQSATAAESPSSPNSSEEEFLLHRIRVAALMGHLKPTQESIRKFLGCRQWKAGSLNRQYAALYGNARGQQSRATESRAAKPSMAHA